VIKIWANLIGFGQNQNLAPPPQKNIRSPTVVQFKRNLYLDSVSFDRVFPHLFPFTSQVR